MQFKGTGFESMSSKPSNLRLSLVLVFALAYAAYLSGLAVSSHFALKTQMNDLGDADQAIWHISNGDFSAPASNNWSPFGTERSRFNMHMNFIFWLLSLFYKVYSDPIVLLILTSAFCAAAGLGLYAIARHHLGDTWWTLVAPLAFWMSPIVHDSNLYDFHVITLVAALVVWMFWAFETRHLFLGWIFLCLALLCKEDVSLILVMFGIYLLINKRRIQGIWVIATSVVYLIFVLKILLPFFEGWEPSGPATRYYWLGKTSGEIFETVFKEPMKILSHLANPDRLRLPLYFLLSGAVVGLFRAWPVLLMLLPHMLAGMLSDNTWNTRITGTYYWIVCFAVIVIAVIKSIPGREKGKSIQAYWRMGYLGCVTVFFSLLLSPLPHGLFSEWKNYRKSPNIETLYEISRAIPKEAYLCAQNNLGAHISQRPWISTIRRKCRSADFILFRLRYDYGANRGLFIKESGKFLVGMEPKKLVFEAEKRFFSKDWELIVQKDGYYLFRRRNSHYPSPFPPLRRKDVLSTFKYESTQFLEGAKGSIQFRPRKMVRYLNCGFDWKRVQKDLRSFFRKS